MAGTVVQYVALNSSGNSTYTMTFSNPVQAGNVVIAMSFGDIANHTAPLTLGSTDMTTDQTTYYGSIAWASIVASGGETNVTVTLASTSNWRGVALEVSGLVTPVATDAIVGFTPTGEGTSTFHSCEYTNSGGGRFGVAFFDTFNPATITGANGSTFYGGTNRYGCVVKSDLPSGAGSLDFTLSGAHSVEYSLITYEESTGGPPIQSLFATITRNIPG
jgi:hypothetical protein